MELQQIVLDSDISELSRAERFIDELVVNYNIADERYGAFTLSVIEAVNNALLYGNKKDPSKKITISAWKEEEQLNVSVEDEGEGFDFEAIENPTLPENVIKEAGRGLFLMKTLSDSLSFENNGAKVILSYNL
ncbi:MAG: ATP-binding protein [Marinifilaceae bacterium]